MPAPSATPSASAAPDPAAGPARPTRRRSRRRPCGHQTRDRGPGRAVSTTLPPAHGLVRPRCRPIEQPGEAVGKVRGRRRSYGRRGHDQPAERSPDMTSTVQRSPRNGVDVPTLFATLDAVKAAPADRRIPVPGPQRLDQRHPQPLDDPRLLRRRAGGHVPPEAVRVRRRPPAGPGRIEQRPDPGRVPAARDRRLPDRGPGQHRRRPRRHAAPGALDRRGRHRPARHPRPVRRRPQRLPADPRVVRDRRRRVRRGAGRPRRTVPPPLRRLRRAGQRHRCRDRRHHPEPVPHPAGPDPGPTGQRGDSSSPPASTPAARHRGWDVVVVGARVAGAATAMLLAREGLRVLCVDRSRYGSDTLSTHALMRGGVLQLQRWGLLGSCAGFGHAAGAADGLPLRRAT